MLETAGLRCKVDGCELTPVPHGAGVPVGSLMGKHCGAVHTPTGEKWFPPSIGQNEANTAMVHELNSRLMALENPSRRSNTPDRGEWFPPASVGPGFPPGSTHQTSDVARGIEGPSIVDAPKSVGPGKVK